MYQGKFELREPRRHDNGIQTLVKVHIKEVWAVLFITLSKYMYIRLYDSVISQIPHSDGDMRAFI